MTEFHKTALLCLACATFGALAGSWLGVILRPEEAVPQQIAEGCPSTTRSSRASASLQKSQTDSALGSASENANASLDFSAYPVDEWIYVPTDLVLKSYAPSIFGSLASSPSSRYSHNVIRSSLLKLTPETEKKLQGLFHQAALDWTMAITKNVERQGAEKSVLTPTSSDLQRIAHELDSQVQQLIGMERAYLFKVLANRDLNYFFQNKTFTATFEGNELELRPSEFGGNQTYQITSLDPSTPLFYLVSQLR